MNLTNTPEKRITLATKLTISRLLILPFIIWGITNSYWGLAFWLIIVAAITDLIDGPLARMRNEKTILGSILDPLADKLFIVSCYILFSLGYSPSYLLPTWFTYLVLIKEFILVSAMIMVFSVKGYLEIKPLAIGKITMDAHVCFIIWLFAAYFFNWQSIILFNIWIYSLAFLVLICLIQYVKIGFKQFISIGGAIK